MPDCLNGWVYYNGYCYYAESNATLSADQNAARPICESMGTQCDLVSISDTAEYNFVKSIS